MLQSLAQSREGSSLEVVYKAEAGLVLTGAEAKAAREKNLNLNGARLKFFADGPYLVGLRIGRYRHAAGVVDELRNRKILLKKREIEKIAGLISQKGFIGLPGEIYLKDNLVKVELWVGRVYKKWRKKQKLIEKQLDRDQERQWREEKL